MTLGLLLPPPAFAQLDTATVIGTVTDTQSGVVRGTTVTVRNTDTGLVRSTVSDAEGRYRLAALPPGSYELRAELQGFSTSTRTGVTLPAGSESVIHFSLAPSGVTEAITVTADVPVVQTTTSAIQTTLTRREIELLPLIGRSYVSLLRLAPTAASNNSSYGFGGSRARSNQWFVDGLENSEDISGFGRTTPAIDSIQEVQIVVNGFKAEFGQSSGGVVNVITRSGTNTPRGSGFFLFRNQDLIARDPYAGEKDPFRRIHYGGTAGGPLRRDRLHYFASYEREDRDTFAGRHRCCRPRTRRLPRRPGSFCPKTTFRCRCSAPAAACGSHVRNTSTTICSASGSTRAQGRTCSHSSTRWTTTPSHQVRAALCTTTTGRCSRSGRTSEPWPTNGWSRRTSSMKRTGTSAGMPRRTTPLSRR